MTSHRGGANKRCGECDKVVCRVQSANDKMNVTTDRSAIDVIYSTTTESQPQLGYGPVKHSNIAR